MKEKQETQFILYCNKIKDSVLNGKNVEQPFMKSNTNSEKERKYNEAVIDKTKITKLLHEAKAEEEIKEQVHKSNTEEVKNINQDQFKKDINISNVHAEEISILLKIYNKLEQRPAEINATGCPIITEEMIKKGKKLKLNVNNFSILNADK